MTQPQDKQAQPQDKQSQIKELVGLMRENRVDAWDLGFQGQLSPSDLETGLSIYLKRFGYAQTKNQIVRFLSKKPRK